MEDDAWSFGFSTSSRSYQSTLKSQNDLCIDFEEIEDDDDLKTEYPCPFCSDDFDLLGLCCHIEEEHPLEATSGVCPVCATRVGANMVGHITTQHASFFKSHHKLKHRKGDSYSPFSSFRKEFHDGHFQSFVAKSSSSLSSSKMAPDPLVSFLSYVSPADQSESVQSASSNESSLEENSSDEKILERNVHPSPLSDKDHMERSKRCEFVQGLLLSTIFDCNL